VDLEHARELAFLGTIDAARDMTRRSTNGVVHDEGGVALLAGPHWLPVLVNAVARLDPAVSPTDVLDRARAFFGEHKRGYSVLALGGRDDDLLAAAEAAGLVDIGDAAPLMAIEEPPATIDVPKGMRIERVTSEEHATAVADICSDAYAVYRMPVDVPPAVMSPPSILLAPHIAAYLAIDDEGPVATATSLGTHGTAYLQWVGTRPRAFGRGAGAAVTQAATIGGFEIGASLATLGASPMGAPIYRRLGWTDVGLLDNRVAFKPPVR
jgi:hypothetical protein